MQGCQEEIVPKMVLSCPMGYGPKLALGQSFLFHLARAASLAIVCRRSLLKRLALDLPPFNPPLHRLEGCRFESLMLSRVSPVAISTINLASWFGSRGRFAMRQVCHNRERLFHRLKTKLRHYPYFQCAP
jgi:hypothetical protein